MEKILYTEALKARENAYAPFSGFQVGAALLTEDGQVYTGVNIENSSYGATICAERTAFVKAISEGHRKFKALAVTAGDEQEALPCGICRQFMYEFSPELEIITGTDEEHLNIRTLEELLPLGFRLEK
ncbi:MAG: cytidine deaminase [Firmicutes bacterium]|nr:cytidine deaminase [Bacillota bacterium]MBR3787449.1 cytidine deaminase [Bacillota bacterium]MBR6799046.1 cytidine deaminase [Bacillota bacterium]